MARPRMKSKAKLATSTVLMKRKFPNIDANVKVMEERTLEEKIERKNRNKKVKFDGKWEQIQKEMTHCRHVACIN